MDDFQPGQNPFAKDQADIPSGVNPFAVGNGQASALPAIPPQQPAYQSYQKGSDPYADVGRFGENPGTGSAISREAGRQGGLLLRQTINAMASPAVLIDRSQAKLSNALTGKHIGGTLGEDLNARLTGLGLPVAARPLERFTQNVAESAPAFALPGTLPAQFAGNAAISAAQAPAGSEMSQAWLGGGLGAAGQSLARAVGGFVRPTADAQTLLDAGIALTPGQAAGAGSRAARFEQSLASNPLASNAIRGAQRRAVEDANVAAAQSVARLVDDQVKLGRSPREAIDQTRDVISNAYDSALSGMATTKEQLSDFLKLAFNGNKAHPEISSVLNNPNIPPKAKKDLANYMTLKLQQAPKDIDGAWLKEMDSEVGYRARQLASSPDPLQRAGADAWREVQLHIRNLMEESVVPAQQGQLNQINNAYRQLLALERAIPAGGELATPRKLRASLEKLGIKNQPLNQVSEAMSRTLPNSVPDSGTAERLLANAIPALLMGGGGAATGLGYGTLGAGLTAAGALGTRGGQRFLTGQLAGQQMLSNALRRSMPHVSATVRKDDE